MANLFDYIKWRGDIPFSSMPVNPVDALIFAVLSYLRLQGLVPETPERWITMEDAAKAVLNMPDPSAWIREKNDITLLKALSEAPRFRGVGLSFYQDVYLPGEETQFAAVTFYLDDGSALLAFRGTDNTLVGWKEDLRMSFRESVPAQRRALAYLENFTAVSAAPVWLAGHSKGGNVAVYAAAKCGEAVQPRIQGVFNLDGPGFTGAMLTDPGYLSIIPRIHTFVPQSSMIGMLLEHEEPYTVIKSDRLGGIMQHDPYTWEVLGPAPVPMEELTADAVFLSKTFKIWLSEMDEAEWNAFVDALFGLLSTDGVDSTGQIAHPRQLLRYFHALSADEETRKQLTVVLTRLLRAARSNLPERPVPAGGEKQREIAGKIEP